MTDTVSSLAQKLRPYWLRDVGAGNGGYSASGSGAMLEHALSGPYHLGELDPSQATWAVTDAELVAHTGNPDAHHPRVTAGAGIGVGGVGGQVVSLLAGTAQYQVLVTGASPFAPSYTLLSSLAGAGLGFSGGQFAVNAGVMISTSGDVVSLSNGSAQYQIPVTQANPYAPAYMALSSFAGPGLVFSTSVFAVGAGDGITVNPTNVALTTPGGLSVTSTNNSTGNHTHAVTASASPGAASALLKTDAAGLLTLAQLAIGGAMTLFSTDNIGTGPDIQFASNALIAAEASLLLNIDSNNDSTNAALYILKDANTNTGTQLARFDETGMLSVLSTVRVPLLDTAAGHMTVQPAADLLLNPGSSLVKLQSGVALRSYNYASQLTGMQVTQDGQGDFRYLYVDEMHAKSFIADLEQALAGGQIISKSVTMLAAAFTVPAAGAAADLVVRDLPSAPNMAVFQAGDIIRLRQFSRAAGGLTITDCWGAVTGYLDGSGASTNGGEGNQQWTFTRSTAPNAGAMAAGTVLQPDLIVLDYGVSGNGFYEVNAIDGLYAANSPYWQIVRWTGHPATGQSVRVRGGQLKGIFSQDEFGIFAGTGTGNDDRWLRLSDYAAGNGINNLPFRMYASGVEAIHFGAWNDVWLGPSSADKRLSWDGTTFAIVGQVTAVSGYIGTAASGWSIDSNAIYNNQIRIVALSNFAQAARIEVGDYNNNSSGLVGVVGLRGGDGVPTSLAMWAGRNYTNRNSAPYRLTLGGSLYAADATLMGSLTAANGEAVLDTAGLALVSAASIGAVYDTNSLRFLSAVGGSRIAALSHSINVGTTQTLLSLANTPAANYKSDMYLLSIGNNADATLRAQASRGANTATVLLSATGTGGTVTVTADSMTVTVPTVSFSGAVTFGSQPTVAADGKIDGAWFFKTRTSPSALASYLPVWFDGSLLKARLPDGTIKTISWV